ncbi:MAG: drug/metabolite transporter (DMT)-like permease [Saprospiraceae bacterium]|jgi:drug/metabolite transporter (DMT)-like permease
MSPRVKAHIALFLVALIYGANYTISKVVLDDGYIKPLGFVLMRVICGLVFFTLVHRLFIKEQIKKKDIGKLILCGIFGVAINQMFFFMGLKLSTPINASLIMTTTPIIVLIVSAIYIKERITFRKLLGVLIGASGAIILILYGEQVAFSKDRALGDFLIFVNATSYGIYLVLVKSLMKDYNPITVVKWVFTFGIIFVFPFGINQLTAVEWSTFSTHIWIAVAYVLICTTILAYLFNTYALKTVQAATVGIYIYLQPLLATLIAVIFESDQLVFLKVISGMLIFIGVYLVSSGKPNFKR